MSRCLGSTSVTSRSPMRIAPSLTSSSPAMQRKRVVLPQPDGPTSTMNSPSWIVRSTQSTARTPFGNVLTTVCSSMPATSRSALQPGRHDPARELSLQGEERHYRRQREHHRAGKRGGYQRDLLSRVVVARGDLHTQRSQPVGQKQLGPDVLAPPAGAEQHERDCERSSRVRQVDLQERPEVAAAVDRGSVVELGREAGIELAEEEDQEGVSGDAPDQPGPARRVHPELDDDPEGRNENDRERDQRRPEHEDEDGVATPGPHAREGVTGESARDDRRHRRNEGEDGRVPEVVREREQFRPRKAVIVPVRGPRYDG